MSSILQNTLDSLSVGRVVGLASGLVRVSHTAWEFVTIRKGL